MVSGTLLHVAVAEHVDIAALSETRFADAGELHEKGYTFYWTTCAMDKKAPPVSVLLLQND